MTTWGVGAILSAEPAEIVRRLTFATKEAAAAGHEDLFHAMSRVNLAHAVMLRDRNLIPPEAARALVALMAELFERGPSSVALEAGAGDLYRRSRRTRPRCWAPTWRATCSSGGRAATSFRRRCA